MAMAELGFVRAWPRRRRHDWTACRSLRNRDIAPSSFLTGGPAPSRDRPALPEGAPGPQAADPPQSGATRWCPDIRPSVRPGSRGQTPRPGTPRWLSRPRPGPCPRHDPPGLGRKPLRVRRLVMLRRYVFGPTLATLALLAARPVSADAIQFTG